MTVRNNAMITRRELIRRICTLFKNNQLVEQIDRIQLHMRPKDSNSFRCCIYKDRAIINYKIMPILGYRVDEECDELDPPSFYAKMAMVRDKPIPDRLISVIGEACSSCPSESYQVTNLCQGCEGQFCMMNCPKNCIEMVNGHAVIDQEKCVLCGRCQSVCPFHAIVHMGIPCSENCPVDAITKDTMGKAVINHETCIRCGKCLDHCPYGAITERSHLIDVLKALRSEETVVALIAPALAGQFKCTLSQLTAAIQQVGFDQVIEVAEGAEETIRLEAKEWEHKMAAGQKFLTSSCCASYQQLVARVCPSLGEFVSDTPSPLSLTAGMLKSSQNNSKLVFISPCIAKKLESQSHQLTDFTLTIEELGAMFAAYGVEFNTAIENEVQTKQVDKSARCFAYSGGVSQAVGRKAGDEFKPHIINGLNRKEIKWLQNQTKAIKTDFNFIEVMVCEGGCVNGCDVIANPLAATNQIRNIS